MQITGDIKGKYCGGGTADTLDLGDFGERKRICGGLSAFFRYLR
jgi:hypothetical protein